MAENEPNPEPTEPPALDAESAMRRMLEHAASMRASAQEMIDVAASLEATFAARADDAQLAAAMRRRVPLPAFPEAASPVAISTAPPSSGAPASFVSISPLEIEVSKASIHAVAHAVPAARKENRWLTIGLYVLATVYALIQLARGH